MTTYHPTIPQPGDDPTNSQQDLLDNFGKLNSDWSVNHTALTSGNATGQHTKIFFAFPLAADPSLTGKQGALYTKTAVTGTTELFFENLTRIVQLTNINLMTEPIAVGPATGTIYGFVSPWGITFNFGVVTGIILAGVTIPLAVDMSSTTIPFQAIGLASNGQPSLATSPAVTAITTTDFTIFSGANTTYFLIMGPT